MEPIFLFLLAHGHLHPLLENEGAATRKLCCTSEQDRRYSSDEKKPIRSCAPGQAKATGMVHCTGRVAILGKGQWVTECVKELFVCC